MIEPRKKWVIERPDEQLVHQFVKQLGISSIQAKILIARGIHTIEQALPFLRIDESCLHDPFLFYEMDRAVERIVKAIQEREKIVIYGDYDADGVTSIATLLIAIQQLGGDVTFMIPNRFKHGYGPNRELFQQLYEQGTRLLITVDNGIAGLEEIAFVKTLGLDVIVTDHHEFADQLPDAYAVIHPRHPEGSYPFGELAGVGVAFKLACALIGEVPTTLYELAAIGTVADLVPLYDENRWIVKEGLRRLRQSRRPGIRALCEVAGVDPSSINEETLGFLFGPRLNAPGRLGDAEMAVQLLTTNDEMEAVVLAEKLEKLNKERQALVAQITKEAEQLLKTHYEEVPFVIVLAAEGWHEGVVGIVASRLTEQYYRPAIILSVDGTTGVAKGSARSIEGFDLYKELRKNESLLTQFGGHQMAAGLSLPVENIQTLQKRLNLQGQQCLTEELLTPTLQVDVPIELDEIDVEVIDAIDQLRPFGVGFEKPVYLIEQVEAPTVRKIGAAKNHLKMELSKGDKSIDAIGFHLGDRADEVSPLAKLSMTGDLQLNVWNGRKKVQLLIEDISCHEQQLFDIRGISEPTRWLPIIPQKNVSFVVFHEQSIRQFQPYVQEQLVVYDEAALGSLNRNLVFLDLPSNEQVVKKIVQAIEPRRIYAHFYVEHSTYFEGMPTREQFAWYYSFLKQRTSFNIRKEGRVLCKHQGWKEELIIFMTKVFFELGFVKIENGVISICETSEKRSLSEAPSYQERGRRIEMERLLLYAPYIDLKKWFQTIQQFQHVY